MFIFQMYLCPHVDNDIVLKSLKGMSDRVHGFTAGHKHKVYLTTCVINENIHTHTLEGIREKYMISLGPRQLFIIKAISAALSVVLKRTAKPCLTLTCTSSY